jgi:hypothetical protein
MAFDVAFFAEIQSPSYHCPFPRWALSEKKRKCELNFLSNFSNVTKHGAGRLQKRGAE